MLRRALLWLAFAALLAPASASAAKAKGRRASTARSGRPAAKVRAAARNPGRDRRAVQRRLARYRHVVISVRDARGMGDVAAAYLTAVDMINRLGYDGTITIATPTAAKNDEPRQKLEHLAGERIARDGTLAGGRIRVIGLDRVPADLPVVDLYIAASGVTAAVDAPDNLPVHDATVFVGQSVFGNTAGGADAGLARIGERVFEMAGPGVAAGEGGVYADPVALALRGRSRAHVQRFVRESVNRVRPARSRRALAELLDGRGLAGARRGVAYGGLSTPALSNQVATYLQGLVDDAGAAGRSYALVVPKALDRRLLAWPGLAGHVEAIDVAAGQRLPRRAAAGTVYLLVMDPLPHEVFVGMMAMSDAPPLIAGDGALSAAVLLRRPFVVASIEHNEKNNRAFYDRLMSASALDHDPVLERIFVPRPAAEPWKYDIDASTALELVSPRYRAIFAAAGRSIGTLTDHLVHSADAARRAAR